MDIAIPQINTAGLVKTTPTIPVPAPVPAPVAAPKADDSQQQSDVAYEQAVKAALASFSNTYAISDKKFALFKDASGQMITRYVSLRDGTVTYSPAPNFVRPLSHVTIHV